jgi:hypothetical protein
MHEAAVYLGITYDGMKSHVTRWKNIRGVMKGRTMLFTRAQLDAFKKDHIRGTTTWSDDYISGFDALVDKIRPFVERYAAANPNLVNFWSKGGKGAKDIYDLNDVMADWWEWVRHGEGGKLFQNEGQRAVVEAFEIVVHEIRDKRSKADSE